MAEVTEIARRHQPLPEYADVWGTKTVPGGLTCASGRHRFVLVDQVAEYSPTMNEATARFCERVTGPWWSAPKLRVTFVGQ
jgi:hypothetical protein